MITLLLILILLVLLFGPEGFLWLMVGLLKLAMYLAVIAGVILGFGLLLAV